MQNLDLGCQVERRRPKNRGAESIRTGVGYGEVGEGVLEILFILGSRNAYFGAFSGPSEYLLLHCDTSTVGVQVQTSSNRPTPA